MIQDIYVNAYYKLIGKSKWLKPIRLLIRILSNVHLKIVFKYNRKKFFCSSQNKDVIVSLTSFPARINNLWLGIESLLRQSIKPQKIVIWLSKEQFPSESMIPKSLKNLKNRGVEIRMVEGDIRSHKKYYYIFQEHPNDLILLVDDDIIYPSTLIEELLNARNMYPNEKIVSHKYGFKMRYDNEGNLTPYNSWGAFYSSYKGENLFFGSGGGTLLRPSDLSKDVLNLESSLKLCPQADDVWLNSMAKLGECHYVKVADGPLLSIINKNDKPLSIVNLRQSKNDEQIQAAIEYCISNYKLNPFKRNTNVVKY